MSDAKCGRIGLTSLSVNPRQQVAQRQPDDLSAAQAGEGFKSSQNFQIRAIQADRCDLADFLHHSTLDGSLHVADQMACDSHTNDIQAKPEISEIGTTDSDVELPPVVAIESSTLKDAKALPLEWLLDPEKSVTLADRVLARLIQQEAHEVNPHFRDDYRQTFIALSLALKETYDPRTLEQFSHGAPNEDEEIGEVGDQCSPCDDPALAKDLAGGRIDQSSGQLLSRTQRDSAERGSQVEHSLPIYFIEASYSMYGLHPDKVWPKIVERRQSLIGSPTVLTRGRCSSALGNQVEVSGEPAGAEPTPRRTPAPVSSHSPKEKTA